MLHWLRGENSFVDLKNKKQTKKISTHIAHQRTQHSFQCHSKIQCRLEVCASRFAIIYEIKTKSAVTLKCDFPNNFPLNSRQIARGNNWFRSKAQIRLKARYHRDRHGGCHGNEREIFSVARSVHPDLPRDARINRFSH